MNFIEEMMMMMSFTGIDDDELATLPEKFLRLLRTLGEGKLIRPVRVGINDIKAILWELR